LLYELSLLILLLLLNKRQTNLPEVHKANFESVAGFDNLPASIRNSKILSRKHLQLLSDVNEIPMIDPAFEDEKLKNIFQYFSTDPAEMETELHQYAKELLDDGKVAEAWQVLLALA
jgi:hypothetical protein